MAAGYRHQLTRIVTFLGGLYFVLEFLLPGHLLASWGVESLHEQITLGFICVSTMAVGLGIVNLLMAHGSRVLLARKGWFESLVLLGGLLLMSVVTILDWRAANAVSARAERFTILGTFVKRIVSDAEANTPGVPAVPARIAALKRAAEEAVSYESGRAPEASAFPENADYLASLDAVRRLASEIPEPAEGNPVPNAQLTRLGEALSSAALLTGKVGRRALEGSFIKGCYRLLFDGLFVALGSAMFSLLGVYIAAAAYRAFRIRSFEASLMMGAAVIVMLGQIPQGVQLSSHLPELRLWLLEVPNSAAFRAIKIGAEVAGLVMAFRMWLSIESEHFGGSGGGTGA